MRKIRGFKLGRRLICVSRWVFRRTHRRARYERLGSPSAAAKKSMTKLLLWGRNLTNRARSICTARSGSGYNRIGDVPAQEKAQAVPKGHLAVYVGQKDGEFHRVLVPVIYFNHPLFGELLKEAEREYGFQHPGGITIPCPFTDFERVKTRIASGSCGGGRRSGWKRHW